MVTIPWVGNPFDGFRDYVTALGRLGIEVVPVRTHSAFLDRIADTKYPLVIIDPLTTAIGDNERLKEIDDNKTSGLESYACVAAYVIARFKNRLTLNSKTPIVLVNSNLGSYGPLDNLERYVTSTLTKRIDPNAFARTAQGYIQQSLQ